MADRTDGPAPYRRSRRDRYTFAQRWWAEMPQMFMGGIVMAAFMLGFIAFEEHEYWGQPDLPYTVVSGAPDGGTHHYGKNDSCDSWTYHVESDAGRTGHVRGCEHDFAVGETGTARWHPDESEEILAEALPAGGYPIVGGAAFLFVVLCGAVWATWVAWRSRRDSLRWRRGRAVR